MILIGVCFYLLWVSPELVGEGNWAARGHTHVVHLLLEFYLSTKVLRTRVYSKVFFWFLITYWLESRFLSMASTALHNMAPATLSLTVPYYCPLITYP